MDRRENGRRKSHHKPIETVLIGGNSIKSFLLYVKHFLDLEVPRCSIASISFMVAS